MIRKGKPVGRVRSKVPKMKWEMSIWTSEKGYVRMNVSTKWMRIEEKKMQRSRCRWNANLLSGLEEDKDRRRNETENETIEKHKLRVYLNEWRKNGRNRGNNKAL